MRSKYKERLNEMEEEYEKETKRLQESYSAATKQMMEEHEIEVKRLEKRLRNDDEFAIQSSTDLVKHQTKCVTELMAKWEESAFNIEKMQRSVIAKQEELVREQMINNDEQVLTNKFSDIESKWKGFIEEMQKQHLEFQETIKIEKENILAMEEKKMDTIREGLDNEKATIEQLRRQFAEEVNDWRQKESVAAEKLHKERNKLKEDVLLFEERRTLLETLYNERKKMLDDEQCRITKQSDEIIKIRTELEEKEFQTNKSLLELETKQQQCNLQQARFEQEKEQMTQLGKTLAKRAEELEKLSQMALKEKLDAIQALDDIERSRVELKDQTNNLEKMQSQIQLDKQRFMLEQNQLDQQFKLLKELKDKIVCNLCGNVLNQGLYVFYTQFNMS